MKINSRNQPQLSSIPTTNNFNLIDVKAFSLDQLFHQAQLLYEKSEQGKDNKWKKLMGDRGTRKDKVAIIGTSLIQNPTTPVSALQTLLSYCTDSNHNFALQAVKTAVNVYGECMFKTKPKIVSFMENVKQYYKKKTSKVSPKQLLEMYVEHHWKQSFGGVVQAIAKLLEVNVKFVKRTCIELLAQIIKYDQLRRLVFTTLINTLGDPQLDIVNFVSVKLKEECSVDIDVFLQEAQVFLQRRNLPKKTQFYTLNVIANLRVNQLPQTALIKIFKIFFHSFEVTLESSKEQNNKQKKKNKKKEISIKQTSIGSRLFVTAVKGLNKVLGVARGKAMKQLIQKHVQKVYMTIHKTNNTRVKIQLLLFLFQSHSHLDKVLPDRYYRTLYEFILCNEILSSSLPELFFDLILISARQDPCIERIYAFVKRMLQLCMTAPANFVTTTLILIDKLIQIHPQLKAIGTKKQNSMVHQGQQKQIQQKVYDFWKRQPKYCHAQVTPLWQLTLFLRHYHPTVRRFAQCLLSGQQIPYEGKNPLQELSSLTFIEKLSSLNQRKGKGWRMNKKLTTIEEEKDSTVLSNNLDEEYIKTYLQKRQRFHVKSKKQTDKDLQDYADQIVEKQINRINPDVGTLFDEESDEERILDQEDQENIEFGDQQQQFGDQQQQFGDQEEQQFGDQEEFDQQNLEQVNGGQEQQFEDESNEESDLQQSQQSSKQKQFEDVFNQIGEDNDEQHLRKKRRPKKNQPFHKKKKIFKKNKK